MNNDLKIGYGGGSGGFLLLHLLLLSGRYHTSFERSDTIDNIIEHQWAITDHQKWKQSENWPDNTDTTNYQTDLSKLYFFCNPDQPMEFEFDKFNTKTLILYTDLSSQIFLAKYKNAHWFSDWSKFYDWQDFYDSVKADDWPLCPDPNSMILLPTLIQQELLDKFNANRFLIPNRVFKIKLPDGTVKYILISDESLDFNGTPVAEKILPFLNSADYTVKLQDLVNTNGEILVDILDIPPINDRQRDLLDCWRSLHNTTLLKTIGIFC